MLEKLAMQDVESVTTLFALADKCARAVEGRAWQSAPQAEATQMGAAGAVAQGSIKKKKNHSGEKPLYGAPVAAAVAGD
jgi:hypothetical protein